MTYDLIVLLHIYGAIQFWSRYAVVRMYYPSIDQQPDPGMQSSGGQAQHLL